MDLQIRDQLFIVCGASSGFGKAIATALHREGAHLILNARNAGKLGELRDRLGTGVELLPGDITRDEVIGQLRSLVGDRIVHGMVINAGGPPAMRVEETVIDDWDDAYRLLLRWKVMIIMEMLPLMKRDAYGRILLVESMSVKQPVENLVLSNSLRMAVVGMVKTLSREVASTGVTLNILAPGYHTTAAIDRLVKKKSGQTGLEPEEVLDGIREGIPVGFMGDPGDFASLSTWLLSPHSRYLTGQTISVDGGAVMGSMG